MTLTRRLAVVTIALAVPLVVALAWTGEMLQRRGVEAALADFIDAQMAGSGRAQCEADPVRFSRPIRPGPRPESDVPPGRAPFRRPPRRPDRPPPGRGSRARSPDLPAGLDSPRLELLAYDAAFRPADPLAPPMPRGLVAALSSGPPDASGPFINRERLGIQVARRMAWTDGPCAIIVARTGPPRQSSLGQMASIGSLAAGFLIAVLVASGPMVRRIRHLTSDVRAAASSHYVTPVRVSGNDEIAELATAFNDAGQRMRQHIDTIEAREQTLRSFVTNTTHDVMTPLTVLQGHLSAMKRSLTTTGVTAEQVVGSLEEVHYLGSLIHNLGVAAKLEAVTGPLQTAPLDLNGLVERTVARHRPIATARDVAIDYAVPEQPVHIEGDVTLVEQAVSNIVANAVRYNNPNGHVAIVLEARDHPPSFSLQVADDGPGVPEAELGRLADRHYRGSEARTRRPDGMGLGLHIARDVADRHGFELRFARSAYGGLDVTLCGGRLA